MYYWKNLTGATSGTENIQNYNIPKRQLSVKFKLPFHNIHEHVWTTGKPRFETQDHVKVLNVLETNLECNKTLFIYTHSDKRTDCIWMDIDVEE